MKKNKFLGVIVSLSTISFVTLILAILLFLIIIIRKVGLDASQLFLLIFSIILIIFNNFCNLYVIKDNTDSIDLIEDRILKKRVEILCPNCGM